MTTEEKVDLLTKIFNRATAAGHRNPGEVGDSPRRYAAFVASMIRRNIADTGRPGPLVRTPEEALEIAAFLDSGAFDQHLAALMGYC